MQRDWSARAPSALRSSRPAVTAAAASLALLLGACSRPPAGARPAPAAAAPPARAASPKGPLGLTYLGVAGWQLEGAGRTVLLDPYFSRPNLDEPLVPDAQAIARRAPRRADLVLVGHSHVDHLLDAPAVALASGAELLGSESTARVALASGLPADRVITVKGGEDFAFEGFSVRVIPSLHSALGGKHVFGGSIASSPTLPMRMSDYEEGGAFIYLVRLAGHQILAMSTANFIERELEGLRPDIAIVAPGLRQEIHDYTCRLLGTLGYPPLVYVTHFDDWRAPPPEEPPVSDDVRAFVEEVRQCSPDARVVVPRHFERMAP